MVFGLMAIAVAAAQPAPSLDLLYIPVAGPRAEMMQHIEAALPGLAPEGMQLRRADAGAAAMEACIDDRVLVDRVDACIRQLVPEPPPQGQHVAIWIQVQQISNVTGSRVHHRYSLRCIGQRNVATAALGDRWNPSDAITMQRASEAVRSCLQTAARTRNVEMLSRDDASGAPLWRLPLARYLPDNAAHADGLNSEEAVIEVQQVRSSGDGGCLLRGRVSEVRGYYFLRTGDLVEVGGPCTGEAQANFRRVAAPERLRAGGTARIYVDSDGEFLFAQPL